MTYIPNRNQKEALADWLENKEWQVFGTIKHTEGQNISNYKSEATALSFFNRLDLLYHGKNQVKAGARIPRIVFKHKGICGTNLHYHFLATPNTDPRQFCDNARCIWDDTNGFTLGFQQTDIRPVVHAPSAVRYILHEYGKLGADTLFLPATHLAYNHSGSKPIHLMRRLLKQSQKTSRKIELATEPLFMRPFLEGLRDAEH